MGIEEMVCYSDSLIFIRFITDQASKYHAYVVLIHDIKYLPSSRNFSIHHCLQEGKQCADFMAKLRASQNEDFSTHSLPPSDLLALLRNDAMETFFHRA